jgi:hypothetical protein
MSRVTLRQDENNQIDRDWFTIKGLKVSGRWRVEREAKEGEISWFGCLCWFGEVVISDLSSI